jgi:hypothetical protein
LISREDRRDLGVLGLMVLAWGLLVAPLVHTFTHAHGHGHSHGAQPQGTPGTHGAGSVEHLLAVSTGAPPVPELSPVRMPLALARAERPRSPPLERWQSVEESQGP